MVKGGTQHERVPEMPEFMQERLNFLNTVYKQEAKLSHGVVDQNPRIASLEPSGYRNIG